METNREVPRRKGLSGLTLAFLVPLAVWPFALYFASQPAIPGPRHAQPAILAFAQPLLQAYSALLLIGLLTVVVRYRSLRSGLVYLAYALVSLFLFIEWLASHPVPV